MFHPNLISFPLSLVALGPLTLLSPSLLSVCDKFPASEGILGGCNEELVYRKALRTVAEKRLVF